jgi:putative membrane protein
MSSTAISVWLLVATAASGQSPDAPASRVKTADVEFIEGVAADLLTEVELGRLATHKATRPEVREFGEVMIADSGRAFAELEALAAQKQVTLPTLPRPDQEFGILELGALSGVAFDDRYLQAMSSSRSKALRLFEKEASSWGDPDVKAFAGRLLPGLKEHLAKARRLLREAQRGAAAAVPPS